MTDKQRRIVQRDCEEVCDELSKQLESLKGSTILITGGTGFMGTWISEIAAYLNDKFDYNLKLYLLSRYAYKFKEIAPHLALRHDISLISNDIANVFELPDDIDYIIHAASSPDNRLNASNPMKVYRTNVIGTNALLETASRLSTLKRVLNVSSGLIYGAQPVDLTGIREDFLGGPDTNTAMSTYVEGKRMAEVLCSIYRSQQRMDIVTVRPFAFIGPYQKLDQPWAIINFISDAINGGPIRILGDGQTIRSYMYPSDMVAWILNILVNGQCGNAYNVGSDDEITLIDLARNIASFFPQKLEISSNLAPVSNRKSRLIPDVSCVENALKLRAVVKLEEALKRSIEWFKDGSV